MNQNRLTETNLKDLDEKIQTEMVDLNKRAEAKEIVVAAPK